MNNTREYEHSPLAKLDYGFNWSSWLVSGETITASEWDVDAGLTPTTPQINGATTSVFVEGGVAGTSYNLINSITTSVGRKDSRTIKVHCKNR